MTLNRQLANLISNVATDTELNNALEGKSSNPKTISTKTENYTLSLSDKDKIIQMNSSGSTTITIPSYESAPIEVGSSISVVNINTGTVQISGASGVAVNQSGGLTLAQWESGTLYKMSTDSWTFLKGGGIGSANFSNTATGTFSSGGFNYKYISFTGSGTLTITKEGIADMLIVGGGGGGGNGVQNQYAGPGGGAGAYIYMPSRFLQIGSYSITIGGGGAAQTNGGNTTVTMLGGETNIVAIGGGKGATNQGGVAGSGGSGGGATNGTAGIALVPSWGNNGYNNNFLGGGGGGAGGASTSTIGGSGITNSITGSSVEYSKGGNSYSETVGPANTGQGGGGDIPDNGSGPGASGGSGIVVIRVKV